MTAATGPEGDLATLEATVVLSALGSNLLGVKSADEKLTSVEAAEIIEGYRKPSRDVVRWERIYWCVGLLGSAGYLGIGIAKFVREGRGEAWDLAFPVSLIQEG